MMKKNIAILAATCLLVVACGPIVDLGPTPVASNVFSLTIPVGPQASAASSDTVLMVDAPEMPGQARGIRIPVAEGQNGVSWFSGAEWSEGAPDLLRRVMRAGLALQLDGPVVGAGALDVKADCRLATNVSRFQYRPATGQVGVSADYRLINMRNGKLVDSHEAASYVSVAAESAEGVVAAFDTATGEIVMDLAEWLGRQMASCSNS